MLNTTLKKTGKTQPETLVVFAILVILLFLGKNTFSRIDNWLLDKWFNLSQNYQYQSDEAKSFLTNTIFPKKSLKKDIAIILIDDKSLLRIPGLFKNNKAIYAAALNILHDYSPAAIGLEIYFPSRSSNEPDNDLALIKAVSDNSKIVLKAYRRDNDRVALPFPRLARSGKAAPLYYNNQNDETIRTTSLVFHKKNGQKIPSYHLELYKNYLNLNPENFKTNSVILIKKENQATQRIPLINNEYLFLNFDRPFQSFPVYSFYDLLNNKIPKDELKNKIVLVGKANSMTEEKYYTPIGKNIYSPYLSALTLSNLINNTFLSPIYEKLNLILAIAFLAIFQFLLYQYLSPTIFIPAAFLTFLTSIFSSLLAYTNFNTHLKVTPLIFAVFVSLIYTVSRRYYKEYAEKHRIKNAFQHYVTASVVNEILKNPEKLNLHGEERNLTIFFSDIEGFTTLSEGMSPLDVVSLLNEYLSEMTEIIFKFEGLLDKYEGDAIMAVFGAPVNQKDHAIRACRCALENQKALARLREKWIKEGKPPINARIGINTGTVVVGNMGSKMRFDYTVIGDNVNLAARLETANKIMKTSILVSEYTAKTAESSILSRYLGKLKVAGKKEKVKVYEILADKEDNNKETLNIAKKLKENFENAHSFYLNREFEKAEKILKEHVENFPDDKPAKILLEKTKGFQIVPPPPNWEDIITQENK